MFVHDDWKLIWARVPKTGSTAVCWSTEWTHKPQHYGNHTHAMFRDMPDSFVEQYADYQWAGHIRDPWTWLPSFYGWIKNNHPRMIKVFYPSKQVPQGWYNIVDGLHATPMDWLEDPRVSPKIYTQENMDEFAIDYNVTIKPKNVTKEKRKPYQVPDRNDDALAQLIERKFSRELAFYKNK